MTLPDLIVVDVNSTADLVGIIRRKLERNIAAIKGSIPASHHADYDARFPPPDWGALEVGYMEIFGSMRAEPVRSHGEQDVYDVLWRVQSDLTNVLLAQKVVVRIGGELRKLFPASLREYPMSCVFKVAKEWKFEFVD